MPGILTFWRDLDEDDKAKVVKTTGVLVVLLTVFTLAATISYLFTWRMDQSLLVSSLSDSTDQAHNLAGKIGFRWADLLVRRWFGLGSFALVVFLFASSVRLLLGRWRRPLLRTAVEMLSGAIVISAFLAYASGILGLGNALGGGLGGACGEALAQLATNLFGTMPTGLVLVVLIVLWLVSVSKRFRNRVLSLGRKPSDGAEASGSEQAEDLARNEADAPVRPRRETSRKPDVEAFPDLQEPGFQEAVPSHTPVTSPGSTVLSYSDSSTVSSSEPPSLEIIKPSEPSTEVKSELPRIDVRAELPDYKFPSLELLDEHSNGRFEVSPDEIVRNTAKIRKTLSDYKIEIKDIKAIVGPTVTLYKVYLAPGMRIADVKNRQEDIGMSLCTNKVRVSPLSDSVGIEVPNDHPSTVPMRAALNDPEFRNSKAELPVAIGCTIQQKVKVFDLADAPHLLVAGATKQGKSVGLNVLVSSLLYAKHPSELKFVFIDPKMVEFSAYGRLLHHYLAVLPFNDEREEVDNAIVKKAPLAAKVLKSLCVEMDQRYELMSKAFVPSVTLYNEKYRSRRLLPTEGHRFLPYLVVVIDEYADLIMSVGGGGDEKSTARSITTSIIRLAQKGRASGVHVVLATQRPSADIVTSLIKTNFPMRIAFRVASRGDSATILGCSGAEKLIGRGDMLFYAGVESERVQCAYIDSEEIGRLTACIESQQGFKKSYNTPFYLPDVEESAEEGSGGLIDMKNLDERFEEAAKLVVTSQRGSTSDLQRRLGMGYAKAGRVMDQLESAGVVGPPNGSKLRQVLISSLDELEAVLQAFRSQ